MNSNFKLYCSYILLNFDFLFLKNNFKNNKSILLAIYPELVYYLTLHIKLSSLFYSSQFIELFSYELPNVSSNKKNLIDKLTVYNFHLLSKEQRLYIFACRKKNFEKNTISSNSITELFNSANWLEREASELSGTFFLWKKDTRNLMLQYGDATTPFNKSFPSIGTKEIFYDVNNDLLIQTPVTIQF